MPIRDSIDDVELSSSIDSNLVPEKHELLDHEESGDWSLTTIAVLL